MSPLPRSDLSRRQFLALAGTAAVAGASLGPAAFASLTSSKRRVPIGIELYAVRGELSRDLPGTLKQVAKIGYEAVEFYSPYFQWTADHARDVRRQLDDLGLRCLSTHNHIAAFTGDGIAKAVELNGILGSRQIVLASAPGGTKGADAWKRVADHLSTATEAFRRDGMTAGFHNHQIEWSKLDTGERIMDLLAANTPKDVVLQLDVGTCVEAGEDPVAWIKSHPNRIRSVHLKDWAPGSKEDEKAYRVLFNEGVSPWPAIIAAAESVGGVEVYLMEQEGSRYSEFETAERCLKAWHDLVARA